MSERDREAKPGEPEPQKPSAEELSEPLEGDAEFWWRDAHDGWSGIRKRTPGEPSTD